MGMLPTWEISFLRLDGDLYASTMDGLVMLYHKVVPGGLVYVDDYMAPGCRRAVHEFREKHGITTRMIPIWQGEEATYGLLQPDGRHVHRAETTPDRLRAVSWAPNAGAPAPFDCECVEPQYWSYRKAEMHVCGRDNFGPDCI